jgi:hypothetical protein
MIKKLSIVILGLILGIVIFLFAVSPGKTSPIIDSNGNPIPNSIAIIEKPIIGGIPQGIIIRGENINNPVLLYVHGGPGGQFIREIVGIKNKMIIRNDDLPFLTRQDRINTR